MTQSAFVGPIVALGGVSSGPKGGAPTEYSVEIGPSIFWQGASLLAMTGGGSKDKTGMGAIPSLFMSDNILSLNQIIQPGGIAITTAANATSGTPFPLVTAYTLGITPQAPTTQPGNPIGVALESGFAVGGTTANSGTVTVAANDKWRFFPGQFLSLGGAGLGGALFFAKVVTVPPPGTNTITVSPNPLTTQANSAIGQYHGDPTNVGFGVGGLPNVYSQLMNGGLGRFYIPDNGCARGVGVTGVASGLGGNVLIQGIDIWNRFTSEIIAATAGATTVYGKKTYSVILSATPQFTDAHNYTVVTSDLIGLPTSMLPNQNAPALVVGGSAVTNAGVQFADITSPATTTTGDPRGALQLSTKGPVGAVASTFAAAAAVNIVQQLNPFQVLLATQFNPGTLFGVYPV
jgi:hypothetical protein